MTPKEFDRFSEVDISEQIREAYFYRNGSLELVAVDRYVPPYTPDKIALKTARWKHFVESTGTMWGAFDSERLVGFAIYLPPNQPNDWEEEIPDMAELRALFVSRSYRGQGIGTRLLMEVLGQCVRDRAKRLYVSSSQSKATVDFYRKLGFVLANEEFGETDPEEIDMIREFDEVQARRDA